MKRGVTRQEEGIGKQLWRRRVNDLARGNGREGGNDGMDSDKVENNHEKHHKEKNESETW